MLAERLAGWQERYPDVGILRKIEIGDPASPLIEASELAQLLVVGSHGRGGCAAHVAGLGRGGGGQQGPDPCDRGASVLTAAVVGWHCAKQCHGHRHFTALLMRMLTCVSTGQESMPTCAISGAVEYRIRCRRTGVVPLVRRQPMIGSRRLRASRVRADCITDRTSASTSAQAGCAPNLATMSIGGTPRWRSWSVSGCSLAGRR